MPVHCMNGYYLLIHPVPLTASFWEKVVMMFGPKSCKAVNEYKLYVKHREDLKTARIHLLVCMVLDRLVCMESCWLFVSSSS